MEHTFDREAAAHKVRAQFIAEGRGCSLVGFDTARDVYAFDAEDESEGFAIVEDFVAGDIVEATTRSTRPRTVRVTLSQTPYTNRNGDIVLLGDGGPVVVDPATVERHGPALPDVDVTLNDDGDVVTAATIRVQADGSPQAYCRAVSKLNAYLQAHNLRPGIDRSALLNVRGDVYTIAYL